MVVFFFGSLDGLMYIFVGGVCIYVFNIVGGDGFLCIIVVDIVWEWISGCFEVCCYCLQEGGGVEIIEGVFIKVFYIDIFLFIFSSGVWVVIDGVIWIFDFVVMVFSDG